MQDFFENNQNGEDFEEEDFSLEENEEFFTPDTQLNPESMPIFNPVNYTEVKPVKDHKQMSRGLKVFSLILALVILATGSLSTGYFIGKYSNRVKFNTPSVIELESTPSDSAALTPAGVYNKVNPSVVGITVYNAAGKSASGSGVIFSEDGYIITNDHCYADIAVPKFKIYTHDGKEYDAEFVAGDVISDLAVLKVNATGFTPVIFGNSDEIYHGQDVVAIGRPTDAIDDSSITNGVVSAVSRRIQTTSNYSARMIQVDCAINPGSSGGALVNMYGQVIGITSAKMVATSYENIGYAIPSVIVKRIVDELIEKGTIESRAKLGITYYEITSVMKEINNYAAVGLYIDSVAEDSGLYGVMAEGDIMTVFNDIPVTNANVVLDEIERLYAGDTVSVSFVRNGQTYTVNVVLGANVGSSSYVTSDSGNNNNGPEFNFPEGE